LENDSDKLIEEIQEGINSETVPTPEEVQETQFIDDYKNDYEDNFHADDGDEGDLWEVEF
jgi:hypothetical protein